MKGWWYFKCCLEEQTRIKGERRKQQDNRERSAAYIEWTDKRKVPFIRCGNRAGMLFMSEREMRVTMGGGKNG